MAQEHQLAIHPIGHGASRSAPPAIDVVFLHGLGGHWRSTWQNGPLSWPEILAKQWPNARVWSAQYPAKLGDILGDVAKAQSDSAGIAIRLSSVMGAVGIARGPGDPPCVLVCHSLGGIVAKRMLFHAFEHKGNASSAGIDHDRVQGLVFLGTPHRGAEMAQWLNRAEGGVKALLKTGASAAAALLGGLAGAEEVLSFLVDQGPAASTLVDELERGSDELTMLNEDFARYFVERHAAGQPGLHVRTLAERLPLAKLTCVVVDAASADPNLRIRGDAPVLPVYGIDHADHRTLCKPRHEQDEVCLHLNGLLDIVLGRGEAFGPSDRLSQRVLGSLRAHPDLLRQVSAKLGEEAKDDRTLAVKCTRRLVGGGDFSAALDAIQELSSTLKAARDARRASVELVRGVAQLAGWFCTHALVPAHAVPHSMQVPGHAANADDGVISPLGTALLESAAAAHKGQPVRFAHSEGQARCASHVLDARALSATDFRPAALRRQVEERVLADIQYPGDEPIHKVLNRAHDESQLDAEALGRLRRRVRALRLEGERIIVDDRKLGALSYSAETLDALMDSPVSDILSVVGPCELQVALTPAQLAEIDEVLKDFYRFYAEIDRMAAAP